MSVVSVDTAPSRDGHSAKRISFKVGKAYTRRDVRNALGLPDAKGGNWDTGLSRLSNDHFIFCGVGVAGRTGYDYGNYFDGPDLEWRARTRSNLNHPSIQTLLNGPGNVHVFFREDDRSPFTYAGTAKPLVVRDTTPVQVRWSFRHDVGPHPEYAPDEIDPAANVIEGAKRTVLVNIYERNPAVRARCIRRWGTACVVCGFDFARAYGAMGEGYVHVHHLRPLSEIGAEYVLDPERDLRPVCPNCHAMLHRERPALTPPALVERMRAASRQQGDGSRSCS